MTIPPSSPGTSALLPCPFCNRQLEHDKEIEATRHPKTPYGEYCPLGSFSFASDRTDIINAWNARAGVAQAAPTTISAIDLNYIIEVLRRGKTEELYGVRQRTAYLLAANRHFLDNTTQVSSTHQPSRDDLGVVLAALRYHEEATGEKFDDEGGIVTAIERDHAALSSKDRGGE